MSSSASKSATTRRATTSQKCVRAGGKHNDLENVGYTRRHHTFFEMLGNFSFGDYFKSRRDRFRLGPGHQRTYGLPKDKLYVTVFREDDEAEELWQKVRTFPKIASSAWMKRTISGRWARPDPAAPVPKSTYDLGPEATSRAANTKSFPLDAGGRFVEIWNLVFMQFDRRQTAR